MKLYFKSILVNSQPTVPILLWNVTYTLNQQIRREILKDDLVKVKKGYIADGECRCKGIYGFDGERQGKDMVVVSGTYLRQIL